MAGCEGPGPGIPALQGGSLPSPVRNGVKKTLLIGLISPHLKIGDKK